MKTVILAAGRGVRMMPLTKDRPKQLVEVGGRPFLSVLLERLRGAGLNDLVFVLGYRGEMIEKFLREEGVNAYTVYQKEPEGTGHAVSLLKGKVKEDFILLYGDNLYSVDDLRSVRSEEGNCLVGRSIPQNRDYGMIIEDEGCLKRILEKPSRPVDGLVNIGLYRLTGEIFPVLEGTKPSQRGEIELTDAIQTLAGKCRVRVLPSRGEWMDLVTPESAERINAFLSKNKSDGNGFREG